jgi:hypothetical protein
MLIEDIWEGRLTGFRPPRFSQKCNFAVELFPVFRGILGIGNPQNLTAEAFGTA